MAHRREMAASVVPSAAAALSKSPSAKAKAASRAVTMPHEKSQAPRGILKKPACAKLLKRPAAIKPQAKGSSYGLTLLQLICAL